MTAEQKNDYIIQRMKYWRRKLLIDPNLKITVKFVTGHEHEGDSPYAEVFLGNIHYGKCVIHFYERLFSEEPFKETADRTVFHELIHICLNDITSYASNMFDGDDGKQKELERLEETFVTRMERAFGGQDKETK